MIKKMVQYFRKRNDMRLRKWCMLRAEKVSRGGEDMAYTADYIYNWITKNG